VLTKPPLPTTTQLVPGLWGRLTAQGDKQALATRRQESVERAVRTQGLNVCETELRSLTTVCASLNLLSGAATRQRACSGCRAAEGADTGHRSSG
jgi:hypothetical protein